MSDKDLGAQISMSVDADGVKSGIDQANKSIASIGTTAEYVGNKASASLDKTPSLTVNELMACQVTLSQLAEVVRYAS